MIRVRMKLRTRLVVAFLLLAVVPLTSVTLYSYLTTLRAFRRAVEAEAGALAEDMGGRMETVTAELGQRIEKLGELPLADLMARDEGERGAESERVLRQLEAELGESGKLDHGRPQVRQAGVRSL